MANLYASPTGSSTAAGSSPSTPTTLNHANQLVQPGDTVYLLGGTYNLSASFEPKFGTVTNWITFRNYDTTPPVLNWIGTPNTGSCIFLWPGHPPDPNALVGAYVEINGIQMEGNNSVKSGVGIQGTHHIRILNCVIRNGGESGVATKYGDYITTAFCQISHCGYGTGWSSAISYNSHRWADRAPGFHSIAVGNIISGSFDGSTHHSDGNGIILDLSQNSSDPTTADTPPALIGNNVVYQNGGRGIQALIVTNAWVVNNTCYCNGLDLTHADAHCAQFSVVMASNTYFINNISFSWNQRYAYEQSGPFPVSGVRVYYNNKQWNGLGSNFSVSPEMITPGDPIFVLPPAVDNTADGQYANAVAPWNIGAAFQLQSGSPCIDAGIDPRTLSGIDSAILAGLDQWLKTDIRGVSRPQGSAWDMGAYEMAPVTIPPPVVATISPTTAAQGVTRAITITGTGFQSGATVSLGAGITINTVTFNSATQLTVNITIAPAATVGLRSVTVTNPDAQTSTLSNAFTVTASLSTPVINAVTPATGYQGQTSLVLTVTGSGFLAGATATLGAGITVNGVNFQSANQLQINISISSTATTGVRTLTITNPDAQVATKTSAFTVTLPAPLVSTVTPNTAPQNTPSLNVVISGAHFVSGATVVFNSGGITVNTVTFNDPTQLTVNITIAVDASVGVHDVVVTNPDTQASTLIGGFTVTAIVAAPTVTSSTPASGNQGDIFTAVAIAGTGFVTGATVSYGAGITVSNVTFSSSVELLVDLAIDPLAAIGARTITVTNPDAQVGTLFAGFTVTAAVLPAPTVTSVTPNSVIRGTANFAITIVGTGFLPGLTVSLGAGIAVNAAVVISSVQVNANISVASTATLGPRALTVTNADLQAGTLDGAFTVLSVAPVITSVTPAKGAQKQALAVTIIGANFADGAVVNFGAGTTVTRTIVASQSRIDVIVKIAADATIGPRDVVVTNPDNQAVVLTSGFAVIVQQRIPTTLDDITPLDFMIEIPATVFDIPAHSVLKRVSIDGNTRSQNLVVSLVFDDGSTQDFLTTFNTPVRGQQEWSVSTTKRWIALRIAHTGAGLVDLVEIFGLSIDCYVPTVTAALAAAMKDVGR